LLVHAQSGDPFVADELVELLTDLITDAGSEDGLSTVLAQIEDIVVNDVVRSASSSSQLAAPDPTAHSGSVSKLACLASQAGPA
jgi:hypothetical protein